MEPVVIITVPECGAKVQHEKHVLRHGFLYLRRTKCEGWTESEYCKYLDHMTEHMKRASLFYVEEHKHKMFLSRWWTNTKDLVFICDFRSAGCKKKHVISREDYRHQTIRGYTTWPSS